MPLLPGKKNIGKNIEKEEMAGKPKAQSLAIALNVARKNKRKKMAQGGSVKDTAAGEDRPMPDSRYDDSHQVSRNSGKKPPHDDSMTSTPERKQASQGVSISLSTPSERGSDSLAERQKKAKQMEADMDMSMSPASPEEQPSESMDEDMHAGDAASPDEVDPHSGESEQDMMRRHAMERAKFSDGGRVDMDMDDEMGEDRPATMAEAIMRKRSMRKRFADGGMVDLEENSKEQKNNEDDYSFDALMKESYDLDQLSPQPKDSNEHGDDLSDADSHDHIDMMRRKIKAKKGM